MRLCLELRGASLATTGEHPARHVAGRSHRRRHRRSERFLAIVFGLAFLCLLIWAFTTGVPFVHRESADQTGGNAHAAAQQSSGQIVAVGINDKCRKSDFNNVTGQLYDGHAIPCPQSESQKGYEYPANRLHGIAKGF